MAEIPLLRIAALVGFLATAVGATAYAHRLVPSVYPRERTRLDERTYRYVRAGIALGVVLGALGAVLSVVDAVGTVRALGQNKEGLLAGLAILIPLHVARGMAYLGGALLVGSALLAGAVEFRSDEA